MKISLKKAFGILDECAGTIIQNNIIVYPSLDFVRDDPCNEFLYFHLEDEGKTYHMKFVEGNNQEVTVEGSSMWLTDQEGDDIEITILQEKVLTPIQK